MKTYFFAKLQARWFPKMEEMHLRQLASTRDAEGNLPTFAMKTVLRSTETLVHVVCEVLIKQA